MKKFAILILLAVAAILSSCATSTTAPTIQTATTGNWQGILSGGTSDASQLNFVIGFEVINTNGGGNQPLSVTSVNFINNNPCFPANGAGATGSANLSTNNANQVTGTLTLTISSGSGNTLSLTSTALSGTNSNGNLANGAITGTWTLTGGHPAGCSVSGNATFTLCQNATACTVI
jgi:hypothetical protein